jgi:hypothetical protein
MVDLEWRPGLIPVDQYENAVLLVELMPLDPAQQKRASVTTSRKLAVRSLG